MGKRQHSHVPTYWDHSDEFKRSIVAAIPVIDRMLASARFSLLERERQNDEVQRVFVALDANVKEDPILRELTKIEMQVSGR